MCFFDQLPDDLVLNICEYLDVEDIVSLQVRQHNSYLISLVWRAASAIELECEQATVLHHKHTKYLEELLWRSWAQSSFKTQQSKHFEGD